MDDKPPKGVARRGFTLVEIMVVMFLLGLLLSMSIGGYLAWRREGQLNNALITSKVMLDSARSLALKGHQTTKFIIDRPSFVNDEDIEMRNWNKPIVLGIEYLKIRAQWHFETEESGYTPGAFGLRAIPHGCSVGVEMGRYGRCASFRDYQAGQEGQYIELQNIPAFDAPNGFLISMWIKPSPFIGEAYLLAREGQYALELDSEGYIVGKIAGTTFSTRDSAQNSYRLPYDQWSFIEFGWVPAPSLADENFDYDSYYDSENGDGRSGMAVIRVNNIARGYAATKPRLANPRGTGMFTISYSDTSFIGLIDEFTFYSIERDDRILHKSIDIAVQGTDKGKIIFDNTGRLDRTRMTSSVLISYSDNTNPNRSGRIFVNAMGVARILGDNEQTAFGASSLSFSGGPQE